MMVWVLAQIATVRTLARTEPREKSRRLCRIVAPGLTEEPFGIALLDDRQPHVHPHQDGEHRQRQEGRPLKQKSEHDQDKAVVLRMANSGVGPTGCERGALLSLIKYPPRPCEQPEAGDDGDEARYV